MEVSRYVRLIKVVLILTTILLSPIKGLADGRKGEKIEHIENLDMSKKKEVSKTQSRDTVVKRGNSNNGDNSKKTVKSASTESRNNLYSNKLLDCTIYVILALSIILLGICSCLLFVVNKLPRGRSSALDEKCSALIEKLSVLKEELSARVNSQPEKEGVSMNKNKERPREEKSSLSATENREGLRRNNEILQSENGSLKEENSSLKEENSSLKEENSSLKEENSSLKEENSSLKEENSSLKKENENLKSKLQAETAVESPQETKSSSSEANQDKVETPETRVYYIEKIPRNTNDIELATEQTDKSYFKVTVQGSSTSATLSVVEEKLDSILDKTSGFVSIEQGYGGPVAELISEGKGTIKYTGDKPEFTLTDKIKYKKV